MYLQKLSHDFAESFIQKNDSDPPEMVERVQGILRRLGENSVLVKNHWDRILLLKTLHAIFHFYNFKKIEHEGKSFQTTPSSSPISYGDDNYW